MLRLAFEVASGDCCRTVTVLVWSPRPVIATTMATSAPRPGPTGTGSARGCSSRASVVGPHERCLNPAERWRNPRQRPAGRLGIRGPHERLADQHGVHTGRLQLVQLAALVHAGLRHHEPPGRERSSSSKVRRTSTEKSVRSRLLIPITPSGTVRADSSSNSSCTSTSISRPSERAASASSASRSGSSAATISSTASAPAAAAS